MVPRTPRRRKFRKRYNRKFVKIFAVGMAVSSISIGSAQLTGTTYSAFNSSSSVEMEISSCYIFPRTINNYEETVISLAEDINTGFKTILEMSIELGFDPLEKKKEQLFQMGDNNGNSASAETDSPSTDDVLSALKGQIERSNQLLAENEGMYQALLDFKDEISEFENTLGSFAEELETLMENFNDSPEIVAGIIQEIRVAEGKAKDCYEDNFFSNLIMDLEKAEKNINDTIKSLTLEKTNLEQITEKINNWKSEIDDKITDLDSENSRLSTIISNSIDEINQKETQKQEEANEKAKEDELKSEDPAETDPITKENPNSEDGKSDKGEMNPEQEQKDNIPIPKPADEVKKQDQIPIPDPVKEEKVQEPILDTVKGEESKDSTK